MIIQDKIAGRWYDRLLLYCVIDHSIVTTVLPQHSKNKNVYICQPIHHQS